MYFPFDFRIKHTHTLHTYSRLKLNNINVNLHIEIFALCGENDRMIKPGFYMFSLSASSILPDEESPELLTDGHTPT